MCRFHTEDYLVRSVSLRHPVLWSILKLLSSSAIALAIACVAYRMRHFIFTYACHMHECLSYARPARMSHACHMHLCLSYARMLAKCTYAWHMHVCLQNPRIPAICTYYVCVPYARMPDARAYAWRVHVYLIYARMHAKVCKDSGVQADRLSRTFRRFSWWNQSNIDFTIFLDNIKDFFSWIETVNIFSCCNW